MLNDEEIDEIERVYCGVYSDNGRIKEVCAQAKLANKSGGAEAVARYAGVDMSRFTIEWLIEPDTTGMGPMEKIRTLAYKERLPVGTLLYAHPSVAGMPDEPTFDCHCTLRERMSGHRTDCPMPQVKDYIESVRAYVRALGGA